MKLGVKLFFIALILFSGVHIIHAQSVCGNAPDGKPWCAVTLGSGRDAGVPQSNYFSGTASESPQCEAFCGRDDIDCIAGPDEPECRLGLTGAGPFSSQASGTDDPEVAQSCIDINSSCRGTSGADNCTSKEVPDGSGETPCDYFTANLLSADQNYCGVDFTGQECWRYCFANYDNYVTDQVVCRPTQLECLLEADEKDADQLGQIVCGVNNPESDVDNGVKGNQTLFLLGTGVDSAFQLNGFKPFQDFRQSDDDPGLYSDTEFGPFINRFLSFTIGIAGAVVVVMIVVGGFTYVVSAAGSEKTKGKEIIKNSLIGLVLLLGSVALLNTINPQLLNLQALRPISVTITQEEFDRDRFRPGGMIGSGGGGVNIPEDLYRDSTNIPCDSRTVDAGIQDGYYNNTKIQIRVCEIPNMTDITGGGWGNKVLVNSRVSKNYYELAEAMENDGISADVRDSYRTYAQQQALFNRYGAGRAARPGRSNHQMGLAIDWNVSGSSSTINGCQARTGNARYNWLVSNASNYGFKQLCGEAWHWSPNGR